MNITAKNDQAFENHPEADCDAVCVDVTPLKKTPSAYGERETFKLVFETTELRQASTPTTCSAAPPGSPWSTTTTTGTSTPTSG
jgi:hypothetical protein